MTTPDLPQAVMTATFTVFGVPLVCHVLSTGQRVLEAASVEAFFELLESGEVPDAEIELGVARLAEWMRGLTPEGV